jgi:hypothetical protein
VIKAAGEHGNYHRRLSEMQAGIVWFLEAVCRDIQRQTFRHMQTEVPQVQRAHVVRYIFFEYVAGCTRGSAIRLW